jgi:peptide/nickel transport system permease protein
MAKDITKAKPSRIKNRTLRKILRNRNFMVGFCLLMILIIMTLVSFFWTPYDPNELDLMSRKLRPTPIAQWSTAENVHIAGTDDVGRDILSRIMVSGQKAFQIGLSCVGMAMVFGVTLALFAAYFGGWVDNLIMRLTDAFKSIPSLMFAMMMAGVFGKGTRTTIIAITMILIPQFTRMTRANVLKIREREYIQWTTLIGMNKLRVMFLHILPNVLSVIIVTASLAFSEAVLTEASLSYLGLGVQPPDASWGSLLNAAQALFTIYPYMAIWPGMMVTIAVLGFNVMGDGLSELLNAKVSKEA